MAGGWFRTLSGVEYYNDIQNVSTSDVRIPGPSSGVDATNTVATPTTTPKQNVGLTATTHGTGLTSADLKANDARLKDISLGKYAQSDYEAYKQAWSDYQAGRPNPNIDTTGPLAQIYGAAFIAPSAAGFPSYPLYPLTDSHAAAMKPESFLMTYESIDYGADPQSVWHKIWDGVRAVAPMAAMVVGPVLASGALAGAGAVGAGTGAAGAGAGAAAAAEFGAAAGVGAISSSTIASTAAASSILSGLSTAQKIGLAMKVVSSASAIAGMVDSGGDITAPELGGAPDLSDEEKGLLNAIIQSLNGAVDLTDEQQKFLDQLNASTLITPQEELDFDQEFEIAKQALTERFGIETERLGATQLAELAGRGVLESTTGERAIARTQAEFSEILSGQISDLGVAKETAKSDLAAGRRELAQSGYNLTSSLNQNQQNTALQASMALSNFMSGRGGIQANTALNNALLQQTVNQAQYNQRQDLYRGVSNLGFGLSKGLFT